MHIILEITAVALVLFSAVAFTMPGADRKERPKRLTVAEIQNRLVAEVPRAYVPISRG
ncbi:hypothetical protein [Nocardia sp. NBC_01327]|uniref:hypothetical protein n=1 Tax=Nocardia sp. NBC_01327 TaxID=2903593 RepID=UPI002E0DED39|nr:hypothetical protein OG326_26080 [Nocardia sp. NBC_01327]